MSKGALTGEKSMSMMVPEYTGTYTTDWSNHKTWQSPIANVVFNETYIDTSGYELDDLTVFPMGAMLQDPGLTLSSATTGVIQVLDIITQSRLDVADVLADMTENNVPGMMLSDTDFMQVIWGQYRVFLGQAQFATSANFFVPATGSQFGSGQPTTAGRLYCYRIVITQGALEGDTLQVPASRFILNAVVAKEEELPFLMRQKRSYELAG
jgi:hypothetical protein